MPVTLSTVGDKILMVGGKAASGPACCCGCGELEATVKVYIDGCHCCDPESMWFVLYPDGPGGRSIGIDPLSIMDPEDPDTPGIVVFTYLDCVAPTDQWGSKWPGNAVFAWYCTGVLLDRQTPPVRQGGQDSPEFAFFMSYTNVRDVSLMIDVPSGCCDYQGCQMAVDGHSDIDVLVERASGETQTVSASYDQDEGLYVAVVRGVSCEENVVLKFDCWEDTPVHIDRCVDEVDVSPECLAEGSQCQFSFRFVDMNGDFHIVSPLTREELLAKMM